MNARRVVLATCGLVALCVVTGAAATARAQEANAPLAGEDLSAVSPGIFGDVNCRPQETSTFTFHAAGIATGPYPGTFTETGSVHLDPLVSAESTNFDFDTGPVSLFQAQFRIESGETVITGTKRLLGEPSFDGGFGTCTDFQNLTIRVGQTTIVNASGTYLNFHADVAYEATISSPTGTTHVEGTAFAQGSQLDVSGMCPLGPCERHLAAFRQTFRTSQPREEPPPPEPEPDAVFLSPKTATNEVGTTHTVTATVVDLGENMTQQPVANETVRFEVTGSTLAQGSCNTGQDGTCSFTYRGPDLPGADLITAYVDEDDDQTQDPEEPRDEATKAWILPLPTPGHTTGGGQVADATSAADLHAVTFGFVVRNSLNDATSGSGPDGRCTVIDRSTETMVKCLDVTAIVQTPTHTTFFGNALVDGVATTYRIDVDDLGEGDGALLQDTFKIQTESGYAAGGFLTQGNIQIHPLA